MTPARIQELRDMADRMERYEQGGGACEEIRELCREVERLKAELAAATGGEFPVAARSTPRGLTSEARQ